MPYGDDSVPTRSRAPGCPRPKSCPSIDRNTAPALCAAPLRRSTAPAGPSVNGVKLAPLTAACTRLLQQAALFEGAGTHQRSAFPVIRMPRRRAGRPLAPAHVLLFRVARVRPRHPGGSPLEQVEDRRGLDEKSCLGETVGEMVQIGDVLRGLDGETGPLSSAPWFPRGPSAPPAQ